MKSLKVINKITYEGKILFSQGKLLHNNKPITAFLFKGAL